MNTINQENVLMIDQSWDNADKVLGRISDHRLDGDRLDALTAQET